MDERQILAVFLLSGMILLALVGSARGSVVLSWGVERIRTYCLWDNDNWNMNNSWDVDSGANAGQNSEIAVIDSGVDYYVNSQGNKVYHPDLAPNIVGGAGFYYHDGQVHNMSDYQDPPNGPGHGTKVIGIIAAIVNGLGANSSGIIGAAPKTRIFALRCYTGAVEEYAAAINYSVDVLGAGIINISGGESVSNESDLFTACNHAYSRGALIFVAVGDEGGPINGYPELYDSVSAIGAICKNDSRAWFSDYGPKLDFVAPGVDIPTTTINEGYANVTGTSFAAPFASATAALIRTSKLDDYDKNQNNVWDNFEVFSRMNDTIHDLPPTGKDNYTGCGLVNAWFANQRPPGDINLDNHTDGADIALAETAYGSYPGAPGWDPRADVNIDKHVDGADIAIIAAYYGKGDP
jgi:hypothetical protein